MSKVLPTRVNLGVARLRLSELVEQAAAGVEVVICRAGKPVARLTRLAPKRSIRLGGLKGKFEVSADFDAPLPRCVLAKFGGR